MRPEAQAWWDQAQADLLTARDILTLEHWYAAAFFAQQAAEKAIKALFIVAERKESPKTHNLLAIAETLKAPKDVLDATRGLSPVYTVARYPDAANGRPVDAFNQEIAERRIDDAERVIRWVSRSLQSK